MAVLSGVLYGNNFTPPNLLLNTGRGPSNALDYVFSHFCGIYLASTAYMLAYCCCKRSTPVLYPRVILPGFLSGLMWAPPRRLVRGQRLALCGRGLPADHVRPGDRLLAVGRLRLQGDHGQAQLRRARRRDLPRPHGLRAHRRQGKGVDHAGECEETRPCRAAAAEIDIRGKELESDKWRRGVRVFPSAGNRASASLCASVRRRVRFRSPHASLRVDRVLVHSPSTGIRRRVAQAQRRRRKTAAASRRCRSPSDRRWWLCDAAPLPVSSPFPDEEHDRRWHLRPLHRANFIQHGAAAWARHSRGRGGRIRDVLRAARRSRGDIEQRQRHDH